jgi:hypothetical protein
MRIDVARWERRQTDLVSHWHARPPEVEPSGDPLLDLVAELHLRNFVLWHLEDVARDRTVSDRVIAETKRSIDAANQQRNDSIERIDERILEALASEGVAIADDAPLNSETPGSIVDRASILALKIYHMNEQAEREDAPAGHRAAAAEKARILETQRTDLIACLRQLLEDVTHGRRRFKVYYQMKMYNDPALNPRIYRSSEAEGGREVRPSAPSADRGKS